MGRFRLDIEYEGTRYSGWQVQQKARTVQGEIIGAVKSVVSNSDFEIYGSGRTDAGVHALQQVAHLELQTMLAPNILRLKLNDVLPADIHIAALTKAAPDFHARHSALSRSYLYFIARRRTAFAKRYVWWIKDTLDAEKMAAAAHCFVGKHDFTSFSEHSPDTKSTLVNVEECRLIERGDLLMLSIRAPRFLWKMVRRITGTIAEVGRGKLDVKAIDEMLRKPSDVPARLTAPPSGLFLRQVLYKGEKLHTGEPSPSLLFP